MEVEASQWVGASEVVGSSRGLGPGEGKCRRGWAELRRAYRVKGAGRELHNGGCARDIVQ